MNRMINNVQLTWKLARMLRAYRTYNLTIEFSKYEFYNNLLVGVTLSNVTLPNNLLLNILKIQLLNYISICS